ncbi:hypothetical protein F4821DRAFT_1599 [Hypoxylon rubiginosum]|uniref:Uncharacterized protein n=1 Tax=Hypoxylon rubiginosum TaxID=110542 RepID=A0ACC0DLH0_9PEZI|nr:hypothetical protein F4821DRAFT_1599 [Hypoxylon rubiginosum]
MTSQLVAEEWENESPSPPPQGSLLDAAIDQLLKERPSQDNVNYSAEHREQSDLYRVNRADIECNEGDTLVIVEFPPGGLKNCYGEEWYSKRFSVHSERLLATGSRVFADLLSPRRQARFRRRAEQFVNPLLHEYVIDLTPSMEGDELAAQLMELSLPSGVRDWWTTKERLGISPYLVSGHDDHCPHHHNVPVDCVRSETCIAFAYSGLRDQHLPNLDLGDIFIPESRVIDDYCPIRHRANIVRLLLAIEGHDLVLNSASRVYTLAGVANILDCAGAIRDPMCSWFMADPNNEFIDINTEIAFKIGWTLKSINVTRAAFRILVVEKAIDTLNVVPQGRGAQHTIFGRPCADLPDDLQTVVQYAAHKLVDRVQQTYTMLTSDRFYDFYEIKEQRKLLQVHNLIQHSLSNISNPRSLVNAIRVSHLKQLLSRLECLSQKLLEYKDFILRKAEKAPPTNNQQRDFDRDRRCYVPRTTWNPTALIYDGFSVQQRLLTPCFWESLANDASEKFEPHVPSQLLEPEASVYNDKLEEVGHLVRFDGDHNFGNPVGLLRFDAVQFRHGFAAAMYELRRAWTEPDRCEAPLNRTRHIALGLADDEFQYLPLWAGGLDDGTGGVFEPAVPDAELGPIGPGPAYHTGDTVATDASSICRSDATPSRAPSTVTLTAGRSLAAVQSNMGPSTATQHESSSLSESSLVGGIMRVAIASPPSTASTDAVMVSLPSATASTATMSDCSEESFEDVDMCYSDEDTWSPVEEP